MNIKVIIKGVINVINIIIIKLNIIIIIIMYNLILIIML